MVCLRLHMTYPSVLFLLLKGSNRFSIELVIIFIRPQVVLLRLQSTDLHRVILTAPLQLRVLLCRVVKRVVNGEMAVIVAHTIVAMLTLQRGIFHRARLFKQLNYSRLLLALKRSSSLLADWHS